ncbi:tyrosine-protein kinase-like otk [Pholidichthys leucotaenia]
MALLGLILLFVLQFHAGICEEQKYYRVGEDVTLPCENVPPQETSCIHYSFLYNRSPPNTMLEVDKGIVSRGSARADRLSLDSRCSLIIRNITAEDAGHYTCRIGDRVNEDKTVSLNVLTIFSSLPVTDANREVNLTCSLLRYFNLNCPQNSIQWVDETGTRLLGEGVGYKFIGQKNCDSHLTVKHQSGNNSRRYTCQFVVGKKEIDVHYTPEFTGPRESIRKDLFIIIGAVVGTVVPLVVSAAVLIRYRRRAKAAQVAEKTTQQKDEPDSGLTYVTIDHSNKKASPKERVKEEAVTYSTLNVPEKMDNDLSSFYSLVS